MTYLKPASALRFSQCQNKKPTTTRYSRAKARIDTISLRRFFLLFALVAPFTSLAQSAEEPTNATDALEEITVLGTRLSSPEPQPAEVINSEQIVAMQAASVADLLRFLPGITSIEPGGAGGVTEVFIRGAEANFTTVFVNNVLMNDPTGARGGAFDFTSISPVEINRIEVVRGPFSALYGSGALAGAINIDTRAPATENLGSLFQATIGSDGYWQLGGSVYSPMARGHGGLNANYVDFGEPTPGSTRTIASLNGNYNGELSENLDVDLTVRANQRDRTSFPVGSGGPRLAVSELLESSDADEISLGASTTWEDRGKSISASLSYFDRDELTDTPAIPDGVFGGTPASLDDTHFDRILLTIQSTFKLANGIEWGAGLEYRNERGDSSGYLDFYGFELPTNYEHKRRTVAPFVEGRMDVGTHITTFAGLRYDDFSDTESAFSPRVGAVYEHTPDGTRLTLTWGEGRKAASFYALGHPLVGNPDLEPEDSSGWDIELAIPLIGDALEMSFAGYRYNYSNLIDFDFSTFQLVNRSEVDIHGIEIQFSGSSRDLIRWQISAATNKNEVDGISNALLHRPEFSAGAWIYWTPNINWGLLFSAKYEGSRQSSSVPGGYETLPSFTRFDVALSRKFERDLELQLALDNLFDKEYEAEAGFVSAGRQIRLGLRRRF